MRVSNNPVTGRLSVQLRTNYSFLFNNLVNSTSYTVEFRKLHYRKYIIAISKIERYRFARIALPAMLR